MQALVVTPGEAHSARVADVEEPRAGGGKVLLRTLEVGVCGTDREISEGLFGVAPDGEAALVLGHELLGVVERDGARLLARRPRHRDRAAVVRALPRRAPRASPDAC